MNLAILTAGIACIAAAIVGGGIKLFGQEIPLLSSLTRQMLLAAFGFTLAATASFSDWGPYVQDALYPTAKKDSPKEIAQNDNGKRHLAEIVPGTWYHRREDNASGHADALQWCVLYLRTKTTVVIDPIPDGSRQITGQYRVITTPYAQINKPEYEMGPVIESLDSSNNPSGCTPQLFVGHVHATSEELQMSIDGIVDDSSDTIVLNAKTTSCKIDGDDCDDQETRPRSVKLHLSSGGLRVDGIEFHRE